MVEKNKRKIKQSLFRDFDSCEIDDMVYLWRAVLDQALDDFRYRDKLKPKLRKEILEWVSFDNEDFSATCELAKTDPNLVMKVFQQYA